MRLCKQIDLSIVDNIKMCYGTTNRLMPQVVFINGKFWIEPQCEMEYDEILNAISSKLKNRIRYALRQNNRWDSKIIFDMDVKTVSMDVNRKTYGDFEIYLKQNKTNILPVILLKDELTQFLTPLINDFIKELEINDFIVTKTKS